MQQRVNKTFALDALLGNCSAYSDVFVQIIEGGADAAAGSVAAHPAVKVHRCGTHNALHHRIALEAKFARRYIQLLRAWYERAELPASMLARPAMQEQLSRCARL